MQKLTTEYIQGARWTFKVSYYNTVVTNNVSTRQKIDVTNYTVKLMLKKQRSLTAAPLVDVITGEQGTDIHEKLINVPATETKDIAAGNDYYGEITLILPNNEVFKKVQFQFNVSPALSVD